MNKVKLSDRADYIIKQNPSLRSLKPVIEKELIHYDIFFLLQQKELIQPDMTFIGGTSLRLCYGSNRYSEDLDFHAGRKFSPELFDPMRYEIEKYLFDRYGLPVEVQEPKLTGKEPENFAKTWKILIKTHPEKQDMPAQRVHVDIANLPAHDASIRPINTHYIGLPDGYDAMFFRTASKEEILADKLVAIPNRNNIKARDIWDVSWLTQQNTQIDTALIQKKIEDHGMVDFKTKIENRINQLSSYFEKDQFTTEMSRFLDRERSKKTILAPEFKDFIQNKTTDILAEVHEKLYNPKPKASFSM